MPQAINLTDKEIEQLWSKGNDAGNGFGIGSSRRQSPRDAAEEVELDGIRTFDASMSLHHCVVGWGGDQLIAVCDANGPWAVNITSEQATGVR